MTELRLGLIGAKIRHSMAPRFHFLAGRHSGIDVSYELFEVDPGIEQSSLLEMVEDKRSEGFAGLNVTYPVKQLAIAAVDDMDPEAAVIGAVNTLVLGDSAVQGFNTDYSGIVSRWERSNRAAPGTVGLLGAGGVGRAAAFAFGRLAAREIRIYDVDPARSRTLAFDVQSHYPEVTVVALDDQKQAVAGVDGIFNATPVGMYFMPGSPIDLAAIAEPRWVYDAIYSPLRTPLTIRAAARGIEVLDGFELFIGQGVDAFRLFAGCDLDSKTMDQIESMLRPLAETN